MVKGQAHREILSACVTLLIKAGQISNKCVSMETTKSIVIVMQEKRIMQGGDSSFLSLISPYWRCVESSMNICKLLSLIMIPGKTIGGKMSMTTIYICLTLYCMTRTWQRCHDCTTPIQTCVCCKEATRNPACKVDRLYTFFSWADPGILPIRHLVDGKCSIFTLINRKRKRAIFTIYCLLELLCFPEDKSGMRLFCHI